MNLNIETVMTEYYFDPQKAFNCHGLIFLHFNYKEDGLMNLDALYQKLEKYIDD
jgi:hypothetical protein